MSANKPPPPPESLEPPAPTASAPEPAAKSMAQPAEAANRPHTPEVSPLHEWRGPGDMEDDGEAWAAAYYDKIRMRVLRLVALVALGGPLIYEIHQTLLHEKNTFAYVITPIYFGSWLLFTAAMLYSKRPGWRVYGAAATAMQSVWMLIMALGPAVIWKLQWFYVYDGWGFFEMGCTLAGLSALRLMFMEMRPPPAWERPLSATTPSRAHGARPPLQPTKVASTSDPVAAAPAPVGSRGRWIAYRVALAAAVFVQIYYRHQYFALVKTQINPGWIPVQLSYVIAAWVAALLSAVLCWLPLRWLRITGIAGCAALAGQGLMAVVDEGYDGVLIQLYGHSGLTVGEMAIKLLVRTLVACVLIVLIALAVRLVNWEFQWLRSGEDPRRRPPSVDDDDHGVTPGWDEAPTPGGNAEGAR